MNHDDNLLQRIIGGLVFVSVLLCSPYPARLGSQHQMKQMILNSFEKKKAKTREGG